MTLFPMKNKSRKAPLPIVVTLAGISILVNDVHSKNAPYEVTRLPLSFTQSPVIEVNREPFSKVTFTNPVHLRKILSPIVSTLEGISIAVYARIPYSF